MATWSNINEIAVGGRVVNLAGFLRRFRCEEPSSDILESMDGIEALNGSVVQTFHQRLLGIGLLFRVNIRGKMWVSKDVGPEQKMMWFSLPPVMVNPLLV